MVADDVQGFVAGAGGRFVVLAGVGVDSVTGVRQLLRRFELTRPERAAVSADDPVVGELVRWYRDRLQRRTVLTK